MIEVNRLDTSTVASEDGRWQLAIADGKDTTHIYCYNGARLVTWASGKWVEAEIRHRWTRWIP